MSYTIDQKEKMDDEFSELCAELYHAVTRATCAGEMALAGARCDVMRKLIRDRELDLLQDENPT